MLDLLYSVIFRDIYLGQCAMPVFDGLLPGPHNQKVQQLLFTLAHWHGHAKLHMHTNTSLDIMDIVTATLGKRLRAFQKETCTVFQTHELKREHDTRICHESKVNTANVSLTPTDEHCMYSNVFSSPFDHPRRIHPLSLIHPSCHLCLHSLNPNGVITSPILTLQDDQKGSI